MRGVQKLLLVFAIVALLALGLTACGGGDGDDSTAGSTAASGQETTAPAPTESNGADAGGETGSSDDDGSSEGSEASSSDSASGEGSAAFRTAGGDNSIQDFGEEADSSEADEASAALSAYLVAREKSDWQLQCDYLARSAVEPLIELASRSPKYKGGKDCAGVLEALLGSSPTSVRANPMTEGIASLRFEDDRGFALFHGAGGVDYFMPMVKEDGEWKVGSLSPSEFP